MVIASQMKTKQELRDAVARGEVVLVDSGDLSSKALNGLRYVSSSCGAARYWRATVKVKNGVVVKVVQ